MNFKFGKKSKISKGFEIKTRTKEEINKEYYNVAVMAGHKSRLVKQLYDDVAVLEKEINEHVVQLVKLNAEGMKLPKEEPSEPTPPKAA